jgi:branched-chain amino acid aminotransferase
MTANTPDIDWKHLPFGYYPTDYNVRCTFKDGKWGEIEVTQSDKIELHMAATCLHYGQELFEGLKAFRGVDGKIRIFRLGDNAARVRDSAEGIMMEPVPEEIFREMCIKAVKLNERFIPPYGSGASLYIRPLEIGLSPSIGVRAASEYMFMIMVTPVGPYFKSGFGCTDICIMRQYDRVAPRGTGRFKIGGNYAASLSFSSILRKRNTSTNVAPPTSSPLSTVNTSLLNPTLSCPLSPTRPLCSSLRIWVSKCNNATSPSMS